MYLCITKHCKNSINQEGLSAILARTYKKTSKVKTKYYIQRDLVQLFKKHFNMRNHILKNYIPWMAFQTYLIRCKMIYRNIETIIYNLLEMFKIVDTNALPLFYPSTIGVNALSTSRFRRWIVNCLKDQSKWKIKIQNHIMFF